MKFVLKYLKNYRIQSLLAPLFKMLEAIFELFVPLVMASIIDVGIVNSDKSYVMKMCAMLVLLAVVGLIVAVTAQYFSAKAAIGVATQMREDVFKKILSFSREEREKFGTAALTTRITSDINQVQNGVNMVLRLFLRSPFIVFGAAIMAFTVDVKTAFIFAVVIPVLGLIVFLIMRYTLPNYKRIQKKLEGILYKVGENIEGARVIRAFVKENSEIEEFETSIGELKSLQLSTGRMSALLNPVTYVVVNLGVVLILYVSSKLVNSGLLLQGNVVAQVNYMGQILVELIKLANLIVLLMKAFPSAGRVQEIMDATADLRKTVDKSEKTNKYNLELTNVSYTYPDGTEKAINNVSVSIPEGSIFGIIGGTGSGKSTLLSLLNHRYDATEGSILLGGENILAYSDKELSEIFGIVFQKSSLFEGSVRENMSLKGQISDDEIFEALKTAQAYDFVMEKNGLDTMVERGGRNFSGGQRQRLTIARALCGKPKIIVLDDSASALDLMTEARLRSALLSLTYKPTVIIVSQRASSVKSADTILVLEDGEVAGIGNHAKLMSECSVYQDIYYCQYPKEVSHE